MREPGRERVVLQQAVQAVAVGGPDVGGPNRGPRPVGCPGSVGRRLAMRGRSGAGAAGTSLHRRGRRRRSRPSSCGRSKTGRRCAPVPQLRPRRRLGHQHELAHQVGSVLCDGDGDRGAVGVRAQHDGAGAVPFDQAAGHPSTPGTMKTSTRTVPRSGCGMISAIGTAHVGQQRRHADDQRHLRELGGAAPGIRRPARSTSGRR